MADNSTLRFIYSDEEPFRITHVKDESTNATIQINYPEDITTLDFKYINTLIRIVCGTRGIVNFPKNKTPKINAENATPNSVQDVENTQIQKVKCTDSRKNKEVFVPVIRPQEEPQEDQLNNNLISYAIIMGRTADFDNVPAKIPKDRQTIVVDADLEDNTEKGYLSEITSFEASKSKPKSINQQGLLIDWKNDSFDTFAEGQVPWLNRELFAVTAIRGIEGYDLDMQIEDICGYCGQDSDVLERLQMLGTINGTRGLQYIDNFVNIKIPTAWKFVGKFTKNTKSAAICFDGTWDLASATQGGYKLSNDKTPQIMYVTQEGELQAQKGLWGSAMLLDTGAISVQAERGQFPRDFDDATIDQGMVCAQLKTSGEIGLKCLARTSTSSQHVWWQQDSITSQIDDSGSPHNYRPNDIAKFQLHRLNDYRMGIMVTLKDGKSVWHITDRLYAQMGILPEYFHLYTFDIHTLYFGFGIRNNISPQPIYTWNLSDDKKQVIINSDCQLEVLYEKDLKLFFNGSSIMPPIENAILTNNNHQIIITFNRPAEASFDISFGPNPSLRAIINDKGEDFGGWVAAASSHHFDINLRGYCSEHFDLYTFDISKLRLDCQPKIIIEHSQQAEHFDLYTFDISKLKLECVPRTIEEHRQQAEHFDLYTFDISMLKLSCQQKGTEPV